jgi:hypothetical protein
MILREDMKGSTEERQDLARKRKGRCRGVLGLPCISDRRGSAAVASELHSPRSL